jgi:hypothetical protein
MQLHYLSDSAGKNWSTHFGFESTEAGPIRLALNIEDRALADRLTALLAKVPGL